MTVNSQGTVKVRHVSEAHPGNMWNEWRDGQRIKTAGQMNEAGGCRV